MSFLNIKLTQTIWNALSNIEQRFIDTEKDKPDSFLDFLPANKNEFTQYFKLSKKRKLEIISKDKFKAKINFKESSYIDTEELEKDAIEWFKTNFDNNLNIANFYNFCEKFSTFVPYINHESYIKKQKISKDVYFLILKQEKIDEILLYYYIYHFISQRLVKFSPSYAMDIGYIFKFYNFTPFFYDLLSAMENNDQKSIDFFLQYIQKDINSLLLENLLHYTKYLNIYKDIDILIQNIKYDIKISNKHKNKRILISPLNNITRLAMSNILETLKEKFWHFTFDKFNKVSYINFITIKNVDYFEFYQIRDSLFEVRKNNQKEWKDNMDTDFFLSTKKKKYFHNKCNYNLFDFPLQ